MTLPIEGTLLILDGIGIPLYSARGLTQTLTPIQQAAQLRRSINGVLVDLSRSSFQKYASNISCTDQAVPAIDNIWPGQVVTMSCVCELSYPDTTDGTASRTVVEGSVRIDGGFVFYRPVLTMMLVSVSQSLDEWADEIQWSADFEEV